MSTGVQTAVGRFVWHDHGSPDPATATKFYADLLGWERVLAGTRQSRGARLHA